MICPGCGNETFDNEDYLYEICPECFWEYDSLQVSEPDRPSGANTVSLNDYRKIYQKLRNENPNFSCRNQDDMERKLSLVNGDCD